MNYGCVGVTGHHSSDIILVVTCPDRERLWVKYSEAVVMYAACAERLGDRDAAGTFADTAEEAREERASCKAAHEAWVRHMKKHGCRSA